MFIYLLLIKKESPLKRLPHKIFIPHLPWPLYRHHSKIPLPLHLQRLKQLPTTIKGFEQLVTLFSRREHLLLPPLATNPCREDPHVEIAVFSEEGFVVFVFNRVGWEVWPLWLYSLYASIVERVIIMTRLLEVGKLSWIWVVIVVLIFFE